MVRLVLPFLSEQAVRRRRRCLGSSIEEIMMALSHELNPGSVHVTREGELSHGTIRIFPSSKWQRLDFREWISGKSCPESESCRCWKIGTG